MAHVVEISDAQIEAEILDSQLPVLIDFYADWCGPCKTLSPRIEALAGDYAGSLKVVKIDVDKNPMAVQMFRIQAMPTLVLLKDRQIVDVAQGAVDRKTLEQFVSQVAAKGGVESWDAQRLKLAVEAQVAVPVDLRSESDFARAHLPHAISMPAEQLVGRLAELRALGEDLVLYDRTGEAAPDLAKQASDAGLPVGILDGGLLAWEAELLPIERE